MTQPERYLGLDIGERRIGVAIGDGRIKIASPLMTLIVDGGEFQEIKTLVADKAISKVIVGYPRNQSGEATNQTDYCKVFSEKLANIISIPIVFQDESLTSVLAEDRLISYGRPYLKSDIDAEAASLILQDYIDAN